MTKEEIQVSIKSIMFSGAVCGIEIMPVYAMKMGIIPKK